MNRKWVWAALCAALLLAALSFLASGAPDGLERVAKDQHFDAKSAAANPAPLPGYAVPGVRHRRLSTALAGVAGVLIVFVLAAGFGRLLRRG
jgi:hypothetical protein